VPTLLLADPHVGDRNARASALEICGWTVTLCSTGPEAIAALKRDTYDLVVLELFLPEIDGFEVLSFVSERAVDRPRDWPLWVTRERWGGQEQFAVERMAIHLGADGVFAKGLSPQNFAMEVAAVRSQEETSVRGTGTSGGGVRGAG